jgi:hypothetical protein
MNFSKYKSVRIVASIYLGKCPGVGFASRVSGIFNPRTGWKTQIFLSGISFLGIGERLGGSVIRRDKFNSLSILSCRNRHKIKKFPKVFTHDDTRVFWVIQKLLLVFLFESEISAGFGRRNFRYEKTAAGWR